MSIIGKFWGIAQKHNRLKKEHNSLRPSYGIFRIMSLSVACIQILCLHQLLAFEFFFL